MTTKKDSLTMNKKRPKLDLWHEPFIVDELLQRRFIYIQCSITLKTFVTLVRGKLGKLQMFSWLSQSVLAVSRMFSPTQKLKSFQPKLCSVTQSQQPEQQRLVTPWWPLRELQFLPLTPYLFTLFLAFKFCLPTPYFTIRSSEIRFCDKKVKSLGLSVGSF